MVSLLLKNRELYSSEQKKTPVYFIEELNLSQHASLPGTDFSKLPFELMTYKSFIEWYEKDEFRRQDPNDRTKTVWPKDCDTVLEDFKLIKLLGRGGFGKVVLCENMKDGLSYAMKILRKKDIVESDQVEHTKAERTILQHVNHPFLVSLHSAFSNRRKIYFVMELMRGGELYGHLGKVKRFSEAETKFLIACIALALGHLHTNNFIYRYALVTPETSSSRTSC